MVNWLIGREHHASSSYLPSIRCFERLIHGAQWGKNWVCSLADILPPFDYLLYAYQHSPERRDLGADGYSLMAPHTLEPDEKLHAFR